MAGYLTAELIKNAQLRLSSSRAAVGLIDYLVFKRAAVLAGGADVQVPGGTRSPAYQQALSEWKSSGLTEDSAKFFNPFEAASTSTAGFKGGRHITNGPDNTWGGWQSSLDPTPVVHVKGTSGPKEFSYRAISASDLQRHFLTRRQDSDLRLPRLVDLAVWWLRDRDLEELGIRESSDAQALVDIVVTESGLTSTEIEALFDSNDVSLDPS